MSWDKERSDFLKIQEGETKEFIVLKINERHATEGSKIKNIFGKDYYYEFDTDKGSLLVNGKGLLFALTGSGVRENDKIRVKYVKKGVPGRMSDYEVTILEKGIENQEIKEPTPF